jgi:hypothetical protein
MNTQDSLLPTRFSNAYKTMRIKASLPMFLFSIVGKLDVMINE